MKFAGREKEYSDSELRKALEENGLEVGRLASEGRFRFVSEGDPLDGRAEDLRRLMREEASSGRTIWASFDWTEAVHLQTALGQQEEMARIVDESQLVIKTALLEELSDLWPSEERRRARAAHSGTVWLSDQGLDLGASSPCPRADPCAPGGVTGRRFRGVHWDTMNPDWMHYQENILETFGHTPLVRLGRVERDESLGSMLLTKVEYLNPGGSVKDRPALKMIEAAEKEGLLKPGGTIVEPTSGNTGAGLAIVTAVRGYGCVCVMPDKASQEKRDLLKALGAEIVITPTVHPDDPESYYAVAERMAREIPGGFKPGQYENPNNPLAHYETTGPEIWEQTAGSITHFVAGMGTCGTITGTGRYLKEQNPEIRVVGAGPAGSIFSDPDDIHPYAVEGVGEDFSTRATTTRRWSTRSYGSPTASRSS